MVFGPDTKEYKVFELLPEKFWESYLFDMAEMGDCFVWYDTKDDQYVVNKFTKALRDKPDLLTKIIKMLSGK